MPQPFEPFQPAQPVEPPLDPQLEEVELATRPAKTPEPPKPFRVDQAHKEPEDVVMSFGNKVHQAPLVEEPNAPFKAVHVPQPHKDSKADAAQMTPLPPKTSAPPK